MRPFKFLSFKKNAEISKSAKVYAFTKITNSKVDDFTYISYNCSINNSKIGKYCSIASGVKMGLGKHPLDFISTSPVFYSLNNPLKRTLATKNSFDEYESITIGNDVWIGTNVVILDGITVGDGAVIGANSLVSKNVDPYSIVGGIPAKEIRKRFSEDIINELIKIKWWNFTSDFFDRKIVKEFFSNTIDKDDFVKFQKEIEKYKTGL